MNGINRNTANAKVTDFSFVFPVSEKNSQTGRYFLVCDLLVSGTFTKDLCMIESVTHDNVEVLGEVPREIMLEISRAAINHCVGYLTEKRFSNAN